jgi:hypothetical protein
MNMLFFRSEAALDQWLTAINAAHGAVFTIPQLWELSKHWYHNRLAQDYHGRSMEQVQDIFKELGLTSEFWQAT